jgi:hypothetical protein
LRFTEKPKQEAVMTSRFLTLTIALALLIVAAAAPAQELRPYKHPDLDMQFTADEGWHHRSRPGDAGTHERVDPETGIHVLMWYTSTEQNAESYLLKMAHMMDLALGAELQRRTIAGREVWVLDTTGKVEETPVHSLLAVIPSGKSRQHPFENNLYIVQIWCPVADHTRLADHMAELLHTVRITDRLIWEGRVYRLYPETTASPPDLPSPFVIAGGEKYVTVCTRNGRYALVPVTVENGAPNNYAQNEWDKGRQLAVDAEDFPTLAQTGLHAEAQLDHTFTITGLPVADITATAKPGQASRSGFVAEDEDILSVIRGDNRLVTRLGLTHPQLARPLFEVFNLLLRDLELYRRGRVPSYNLATMLYNGHKINIEASGGKGWQESIFDDEVQGYWSIWIRREPTYGERQFLSRRYSHLEPDQLAKLTESLTCIHTSEMVPFYITRYGFYEGHTDYRADPISIATLFGLLDIEQVDASAGGDLYELLNRHYSVDNPLE